MTGVRNRRRFLIAALFFHAVPTAQSQVNGSRNR